MKVQFGGKEIELHPLLDTPKLAAIGALVVLNPAEAFLMKTARGDELTLRFNDADNLLRQVLNAA